MLVNNASSFYPSPIDTTTEAEWDDLDRHQPQGAVLPHQGCGTFPDSANRGSVVRSRRHSWSQSGCGLPRLLLREGRSDHAHPRARAGTCAGRQGQRRCPGNRALARGRSHDAPSARAREPCRRFRCAEQGSAERRSRTRSRGSRSMRFVHDRGGTGGRRWTGYRHGRALRPGS